jgi:hypothetical protein
MKKWKRSGKVIKHHITNRVNGGKSTPENLLRFDSERERAWHFLFKNMSFEEVAELLLRTCQMKGRKKV